MDNHFMHSHFFLVVQVVLLVNVEIPFLLQYFYLDFVLLIHSCNSDQLSLELFLLGF